MIDQGLQLTQALANAGVVGTWEWQIGNGGVVLDYGSAELLAGNVELAGKAIDFDTSFTCLHPDDRERVYTLINDHEQRGGAITMEYRVRLPDGTVRLLLDRGQIVETPDGTRVGFGFLLDITEALPVGGAASELSITALTDIADQCLSMRDVLGQFGNSTIRLLFDLLLFEMGRALARQGQEPEARWVQ